MEASENTTPETPETAPINSRYRLPVPQQLTVLAAVLLIIFAGGITATVRGFFINPPATATDDNTTTNNQPDATSAVTTAFANINVVGEAAYVYDIATDRVLFAKNENEVLPLASLTKLMTVLVAHELLSDESPVTIGDRALSQYGDDGLLSSETFTRQSLSDLALLASSNDGAFALAVAAGAELDQTQAAPAFVAAMNIRADELGLTNTHYSNPTGLDISATQSGANGTAKDMGTLMAYLATTEPDLLALTKESTARVYSEDGTYHDAENTNYYIDEIPGLIGSKTGYTDLAGGNLAIAFAPSLSRPVVVVVLGSTRHERFTDVVALAKATEQYLSSTP